ncbi:hypothetical protein GJ744_009164 [Endocarpon pusillum]|uniref:Uncharacterized protein n=1 Tax=Endocarpon pusillum TaxID=364733 RepID=A0A8H7E4U1_9EURO|nr:hypothetical protein GJ744_009164 [Endocarpon pusillum]
MSDPSFILTKTPFNLSAIPLGSFVPDRSTPSTDLLKPGDKVTETDWDVTYDTDFDFSYSKKSETSFELSFEALFKEILKLALKLERNEKYRVTAKSGNRRLLYEPEKVFETLIADEKVKRWLARRKQECLFVIGVRTFLDAKLHRENRKGGSGSGKAKVPVDAIVGDGAPKVDGAPTVGVGGGHERMREGRGDVELPGERIFAICYRKVQIKRSKGGDTELTLKPGDDWAMTTRSLVSRSDKNMSHGLTSNKLTIEGTDDTKDCVPAGHGLMIPPEFSELKRSMPKKNGPKVTGLPVRGASSPPRRANLLSSDARPPEVNCSARSTNFSPMDASASARAASLQVRVAGSSPRGANLSSRDVKAFPRDTVRGVNSSARSASSALTDASTSARRASPSARAAALPTKPGASKPRRLD